MQRISSELQSWKQVNKWGLLHSKWQLFIGNGFSINLFEKFDYTSLCEAAKKGESEASKLTEAQIKLFDQFNTADFEGILNLLRNSGIVGRILEYEQFSTNVDQCYTNLKNCLIQTIGLIHIAHSDVAEKLLRLRKSLRAYSKVFTTNYDLLLYWAIMSADRGAGFIDFLWSDGCSFDGTNVEVYKYNKGSTEVYYLHGALHFFETEFGGVEKIVSEDGVSLLDKIISNIGDGRNPIFVAEGDWKSKLRTIKRFDYLNFCYDTFRESYGKLAILGCSLKQDEHIIKAIQEWPETKIAFGIYPSSDREIIETKGMILSKLTGHNVVFFDSTTHPLTSADLKT